MPTSQLIIEIEENLEQFENHEQKLLKTILAHYKLYNKITTDQRTELINYYRQLQATL